jgi:ZIP family zinc transporter
MEKEDENLGHSPGRTKLSATKMVAMALIPIVILSVMIAYLLGPAKSFLNAGIPLPEVTIETIEFHEGQVIAQIRNTGPIDITIAQADINDRIHPAAIEPSKNVPRLAAAKVVIPFPWKAGEPYEIGVTTSDGTRFSKSVTAAPAAIPSLGQASFFALVGTYVGIIPVLIGLLWFPFIRKLGMNAYRFFLSLTAGLLVFLGMDAIIESNKIASQDVAGVFNAQILIAMTAILSFLALLYVSRKLVDSAKTRTVSELASRVQIKQQEQLVKPVAIALMVSIGIGFHNFGEGLAIGAAVVFGQIALSTFLIIGFALHNTTEGVAIVAPLAKIGSARMLFRKLALMGLIAGAPTIVGTWIGGFFFSPIAAIVFLSIGAGAIFQVVYVIYSWMMGKPDVNRTSTMFSDAYAIAGFAVGMVIMYATGLIVPS